MKAERKRVLRQLPNLVLIKIIFPRVRIAHLVAEAVRIKVDDAIFAFGLDILLSPQHLTYLNKGVSAIVILVLVFLYLLNNL